MQQVRQIDSSVTFLLPFDAKRVLKVSTKMLFLIASLCHFPLSNQDIGLHKIICYLPVQPHKTLVLSQTSLSIANVALEARMEARTADGSRRQTECPGQTCGF